MGMFDDIEVKVPLPSLPKGHDRRFQTKSMDCALLQYEVRKDGTLWREEFDIEDRSDSTAEGLDRIRGMMTRVHKRWVRDNHTGEVEFHDFTDGTWFSYRAWFRDGGLRDLVLVEHDVASTLDDPTAIRPRLGGGSDDQD